MYIEALINEIRRKCLDYKDYEVISVFFGGGTPSVLPDDDIVRIMSEIRKGFCLASDCEITIEINPGCADLDNKLSRYKEVGINRISIGLQTASDNELKVLGRIHTRADFEKMYRGAVNAGLVNLNVDLISGIPGQSVDSYKKTLEYVTKLNPPPKHISAYSLIVEEGTPFEKTYGENGELNDQLPNEDDERKMYEITENILAARGYIKYEISNYASPGYESRHNCVYWRRGNYLGLGLGASGMVNNVRYKNVSDINDYIAKYKEAMPIVSVNSDANNVTCASYDSIQVLSKEEQMEEFMFLGLRMMSGVSVKDFEDYFKEPLPKSYKETIDKYINMGLLTNIEDRVMLTKEGINVSNVIMADFLFE